MAFRRRGQEFRSSTPLVILLIGVIIILYILFLPPAQREALLSGTTTPGGVYGNGGVPTTGNGVVIIDKYVGTLQAGNGATQEHAIPSTTVFTTVSTTEVKLIDSMLVKKSAFSSQDGELTFRADPSLGKNFLLTFNVDQARGPLFISLNGNPIFERAITSKSPEPIKLPQEYIQPENTITFSAGSTGWQFWSANTYQLRNVLVSADVTSYEGASAEQHFTITTDEYANLDKGSLEFVPDCNPKTTGRLTINVNGRLLYAGFIDCGVITRQDIAKELLNAGDNRLGFTSSEGSYTIDRIKVISTLKQQEYPVFYFNLPPDMFQQANVFAGRVVLTLRFSEGNALKQGTIIVNGYQDSFQTNSYYYQASLDPNILVPNANSVQIAPQGTSLNIPELRVEMLQ
jgi:hypothetical protein